MSSTESHQSVSSALSIVSDSWDSNMDVKPILNLRKRQHSDTILHLQNPLSVIFYYFINKKFSVTF